MTDEDATTTTTTTVRVGRINRRVLMGAVVVVALVGAGAWAVTSDTDETSAPATSTTTTTERPTTTTAPRVVDTAALQVGSTVTGVAGVSVVADDGVPVPVRHGGTAIAFANADGVVVAQVQDPLDGYGQYPPTPGGPILVISGNTTTEVAAGDGEALRLLDLGDIEGRPVALATARSGTGPDDTDERLLLIDVATGEREDLGSVGGWEAGTHEGRLLEGRIVTLFSASVQQYLQVRSLDGTLAYESPDPVVDRNVHLAASGDTALLVEPKPMEGTLGIRRFDLRTGEETAPELFLDPVEGLAPLDGFCFSPDWNSAELLCDQSAGAPLSIDVATGVTKPIEGVTEGVARYPRTGSDGSPAAIRAVAPPEKCAGLDGSSPSRFDPTGGTYPTFIRDHRSPATVTFDVVQWLSGQAAIDAYHDDHPEDPEGPPNDSYIVNDNDQVRTAPIDAGATVWLVRLAQTGNAGLKPGTVDELDSYLGADTDETVYWLTFTNGAITELCEQYRP